MKIAIASDHGGVDLKSALVAALSADGFSTIEDIRYILRGYEDFDGKIRALGGIIEMVDNEREEQKFRLKVG